MRKSFKTLVTAFQPFNKMTNNYSREVLNYIDNVDKIILDVVYDECYQELLQKHDLADYDLIIALGEARSRQNLTLETRAQNIASCSLPDNRGTTRNNTKIITSGPDIIETKVAISKCADYLQLSNDAGKFVCNNLYYHLLYHNPHKAIFIHIPECHNSQDNYQEYARVIEEVIKIIGGLQ